MVKNGNNIIVSIITGSSIRFTELFLRWTSGKSKRIIILHGWYLQVEFRRIAYFVWVWKSRAPCSRTVSPKVQDASLPHSNSLCVPHCYLIIFNLYCISSCPLFSTSLKTFITDNCAFHRKKCRKKVSTSTKTILYLFVNVKVLTQSLKFKKKFSQENWCSLPALLYVLLAI